MQDLWNYCPHCGEKLQVPAHAMQNPAPAANGPARKRVRRQRSDRGKPRTRRQTDEQRAAGHFREFAEHPESGLGEPSA